MSRKHNFWCVRAVDIYNRRHWYRLSPKVAHVVNLHDKLEKNNKDFVPGTQKLIGRYINAPLTPYFKYNQAGIGVVKIIYIKRKYVKADTYFCTRSQFVEKDRLKKHLFSCYHYLRHDYNKYSRLQIFVDLYLWQNKIKHEKKAYR